MIDYLQLGKTVTGVYYAGLVRKLREAVKEKRQGKLTHSVLLHNNSAPVYIFHVGMVAVHKCGFELLSRPLYFGSGIIGFPTVQILKGITPWVAINEWIEGQV